MGWTFEEEEEKSQKSKNDMSGISCAGGERRNLENSILMDGVGRNIIKQRSQRRRCRGQRIVEQNLFEIKDTYCTQVSELQLMALVGAKAAMW